MNSTNTQPNYPNSYTEDFDKICFALYRTQDIVASLPASFYNYICYIINLIYTKGYEDRLRNSIVRYKTINEDISRICLVFDNQYCYISADSITSCWRYDPINSSSVNLLKVENRSEKNTFFNHWNRAERNGFDIPYNKIKSSQSIKGEHYDWEMLHGELQKYLTRADLSFINVNPIDKDGKLMFFLDFAKCNMCENPIYEATNFILFALFFCKDKKLYDIYKGTDFFNNGSNYEQEMKTAISEIKEIAPKIHKKLQYMSYATFDNLNDVFSVSTTNKISKMFLSCLSRHLKKCIEEQKLENNKNFSNSYENIRNYGKTLVDYITNSPCVG